MTTSKSPTIVVTDEDILNYVQGSKPKEIIPEGIFKLNNSFPTDILQEWSLIKFLEYIRDKESATISGAGLNFYINKNQVLEGKITNKISETKDKYIPIKVGASRRTTDENGNTIYRLFFINEPFNKLQWRLKAELVTKFHTYLFVANKEQYILFTDEEIQPQGYTIYGTLFDKEHTISIGQSGRVPVKTNLLFMHSAEPRIVQFESPQELMKLIGKLKLTKDKLMNFIFTNPNYPTVARQPAYFEDQTVASLLSAPYDGYPLHTLMIAKPGTHKSSIQEAVHAKFGEDQEIVDAAGSTIKNIVPSFKNTTPEPGALLRADRIICIDEFTRILLNTKAEDREPQLARMNTLLEHKYREIGSGNCKIKAKLTAKLFAGTNPVYGTGTMLKLCEKIDRSFLSRLFIHYQLPDHITWAKSKEHFEEQSFEMAQKDWLSIYDYLQTFRATYDHSKVDELYRSGLDLLGEDTEDNSLKPVMDVYSARYQHHAHCLMDGLVKLRCLSEKDDSFKAKKKDYKTLRLIWIKNMEGWGIGLEGLLTY